MTLIHTNGGSTVAKIAHSMPRTPARLCPICEATFREIAPGEDWAMATVSSISSSVSHPSSSTNFFRISGMITNPPPKVKALMESMDKNSLR